MTKQLLSCNYVEIVNIHLDNQYLVFDNNSFLVHSRVINNQERMISVYSRK